MAETVIAAEENVEKTYLRRLFGVLGVKGVAVLVAVPVALGLSSIGASVVGPVVVGGALTAVFVAAVAADSRIDPAAKVDVVGVSMVAVVAGYTALLFAELEFVWTYAVGGAGLVLGAVAYDYLSHGGDVGIKQLHETEVDFLHFDIVGFVVAEVLVVYAVLHSTGWGTFADSPVFVVLAYIIYMTTVAAFAGYAVITREIVVSRTADEVHEALVSVLEDIGGIEDEDLRKKLALNIRRVAECLDGLRIPTSVEDQYGRVPAVLSTRKPDVQRIDMRLEEVLKVADKTDLTGYTVHDGEDVSIFRNGELSKHYTDGKYLENVDGIADRVADVGFYALEYPTVKDLVDITPGERDIRDPERATEDIEDKEVESGAVTGASIDIGGDEVDVNDMFTITEEIINSSEDDEEGEKKLEVGGDEIDIDELIDRADDVMDELSE